MLKTSNKDASICTTNKDNFQGNNTFGTWTNIHCYVVYSYGYHFPMYVFQTGKWYENSDKYSVTTSKQQNQLRPSISGNFIMKTTAELKTLINFSQAN